MSSQFLDTLNPPQRAAVETVHGRVLVLAGAGSGKTRLLTARMAHLITQHNIHPRHILGLTFTNKAAAEMRQRISTFVDAATAKQITLCTFHSFCMQILRKEIHHLGYTRQFTLYNEQDVQRLVKLIARDILEHEGDLPSLTASIQAISQAKNRGVKPEEMPSTDNWHDNFTKTVYQRLQESMRAYNAVDFDNLLWLTVELFEKFPDILNKYQEHYRYIMIDEYQDTNPVQYRLAKLLSAKYGNLCVVGDDDQSIYGWRGAEVKNILNFDDAKVIKLEQNYRSTNGILKAANAVIRHNQTRHSKVLWSQTGEGEPINIFHAPTDVDEAHAVICRLAKMKESLHLPWKDFAILYRSNALSRQFEMALLKHTWKNGDQWVKGIPFQVFGGLEFYERREIKDLFAYLRFIVNKSDQEALLRIINVPRRGIGEETLDQLTKQNRSQQIPLWQLFKSGNYEDIPTKAKNGLRDFIETIEEAEKKFANESLAETMSWLIEKINYKKAIDDDVKSDNMRDFKWENVEEFVSALSDFEQSQDEHIGKTLADFVNHFPLETNNPAWMKKNQGNEDKVNLMTFHSAKGLEFKACFLVGMEDHIMPHEKSVKENGIEEERRLMYVAITRAMRFLTLSMARSRKKMGKEYSCKPSPFLFEIPKELTKIVAWDEL